MSNSTALPVAGERIQTSKPVLLCVVDKRETPLDEEEWRPTPPGLFSRFQSFLGDSFGHLTLLEVVEIFGPGLRR